MATRIGAGRIVRHGADRLRPEQLLYLVENEDEVARLKTRSASKAADDSVLEHNAERRVKLGVLVTAIVRQNQIQVDPERVREAVESIAASYEKPEEVVQWYYGNQEMLGGVQSAVMEDQVVDWVLEYSGVQVDDETMTFDRLVDAAR